MSMAAMPSPPRGRHAARSFQTYDAIGVLVITLTISFATIFALGCEPSPHLRDAESDLKPCVRESVELSLSVAGLIAVVATVLGVLLERRRILQEDIRRRIADENENRIRRTELRWRQAHEARRLLQEIHDHPYASVGVQIMDWRHTARRYDFPWSEPRQYEWSEVRTILEQYSRQEVMESDACDVVDAFDWLLYYLNQIAYALESKLVKRDDVIPTLRPYLRLLACDATLSAEQRSQCLPVASLIEAHNYTGIRSLYKCLQEWERDHRVAPTEPRSCREVPCVAAAVRA
jgi:hypothetical protein